MYPYKASSREREDIFENYVINETPHEILSNRLTPLPSPEPGNRPMPLPAPGPGNRPTPLPSPGPGNRPIPLPSPRPGNRPTPLPTPGPRPPFEGNRPSSPPPSTVPSRGIAPRAVDPGAIRGCMFNFTYVWLNNGFEFWFFPTFLGARSIAGFRWNGFRWTYVGFDLNSIDFFSCSR